MQVFMQACINSVFTIVDSSFTIVDADLKSATFYGSTEFERVPQGRLKLHNNLQSSLTGLLKLILTLPVFPFGRGALD